MSLPELARWKKLSPLLDELLGLSSHERDLRLADLRACGEELAVELESLLAADSRAEAADFMAGDMSAHEAVVASLVGKEIGAYVIESLLGEGATGTVWRARRADGRFEGLVAVKLLHLSLVGRDGALRFQREGVILARVSHPNIARLLDAGVTEDGQPYLVLELVEGTRIDAHCDCRNLGVMSRLELFMDVLAAVAHAHSHLIVHRDIKPANIHVTGDGAVKLLDFGIAKLVQDEPIGSAITGAGLRVLTPQYAAPEQLNGGLVTTSSDIYALGVLLYLLLTGQHPLVQEAASSVEAMRATLDHPPRRLRAALHESAAASSETLRQIAAQRGTPLPVLRRQLGSDLEKIVARALRKDPADRYETVAALGADVRRFLAGEPVMASPESRKGRRIRWRRWHGSQIASPAVLLLVLVLGATAGFLAHAAWWA